MRRLAHLVATFALAVALTVLAGLTPAWAAAQRYTTADSQYVLKFGDAINMEVVGNKDLAIDKQPIRPDGRISVPLIGEVQAGGLTVPQLQDNLQRAFTRFFTAPQVVVNVAVFRPLHINVLGMVNKPDTYAVEEPTRLLQVVALAGGLVPRRAELNNVLILRANGDRQIVSLQAALDGKPDDNVMLNDGDTVRIDEVFGPDWAAAAPTIASLLTAVASLMLVLINLHTI